MSVIILPCRVNLLPLRMKTEEINKINFIQIAQLKDDVSNLEERCSQLEIQVDNADSVKEAEVARVQSDCDEEISAVKEASDKKCQKMKGECLQIISERDKANKENIAKLEESWKRKMAEKNEEIKAMKESHEMVMKTSMKTMTNLLSDNDNLTALASKSVSRNNWYRQKYWGASSEQARILEGRNPLTRREEKALFMMGSEMDSEIPVTSEIDTSRRKNTKNTINKQLRLDYQKNKPYTDNPKYIRLDDYLDLKDGEHLKNRNGVVEIRMKRIVKMIPAHFEETFVEVATVRCKGQEDRNSIELEERVVPGVPFNVEMISFILTEHFSFNTTWANIAKKLSFYGLHINDSTLGDIAHRCIDYMKDRMQDVWQEELYETDYWMVDETTAKVAVEDKETGIIKYKTKYLWGIRANKLKLSWFIYDEGSRGAKVIRPYLDRFKGYFTTDGYIVYKLYEKLTDAPQHRIACLTHIRRTFVDALHENRKLMSWFINKMKKLFAIEANCKEDDLKGEARLLERHQRSRSIMMDIKYKYKQYLNAGISRLGTLTQSALKYISHEWPAMERILTFGDAEISNNLCEQMMRHVKINLRNSQNIGSEKCAGDFCFMYSLVESCGFNNLSPMAYMESLLIGLKSAETQVEKRSLLPCYCAIAL